MVATVSIGGISIFVDGMLCSFSADCLLTRASRGAPWVSPHGAAAFAAAAADVAAPDCAKET